MMNGEWGCHIGLAALARRRGPCEERGEPDGAAAASGAAAAARRSGRAARGVRAIPVALGAAVRVLLALVLA